MQRYADAVVVGSAIVAEMERFSGAPELVKRIGEFLTEILINRLFANSENPVKVHANIAHLTRGRFPKNLTSAKKTLLQV